MNKCFVAVSGGVDSATALLLLREKGFDVPEEAYSQADLREAILKNLGKAGE